jgi:LysM repeat protein
MDIEIFDKHLKHVYADNKPKAVKAEVKKDTVNLAKTTLKKDSTDVKIALVKKDTDVAKKSKEEKVKSDKKAAAKKSKKEIPSEIKVDKGDTYYSIAKKYKIKIKDLLKYNKLTETDLLKEGAKIKIPKR